MNNPFHAADASPPLPGICVPGYGSLEGFTAISASLASLDFRRLKPGDVVFLETLNSEYKLVLIDPPAQRATVEGGRVFTGPTEATVCGSSCGGALLKVGWIVIGFQLEFLCHPAFEPARSVVTSSVERLRLERRG
jgi:hypothetical protein